MDFATILWLDGDYRTATGKPVYRRGCPEGFASGDDSISTMFLRMFDDNEDVGNDIGRRQRMAEACYE